MINIVELALIFSLSAAGTYVFISSGIYGVIGGLLLLLLGPSINYYIPVGLCMLLFLYGTFTIVFKQRGAGRFTWIVVLLSLPSLLAFDSVNWPAIFGLNFGITTHLNFYTALVVGLFVVIGYITLGYIRVFKQTRRSLIQRGVDATDVASVRLNSYLVLFLTILAALLTIVGIGLLSHSLEFLTLDYIKRAPWNTVSIGLTCILLLTAYIYWVGARRKPGS